MPKKKFYLDLFPWDTEDKSSLTATTEPDDKDDKAQRVSFTVDIPSDCFGAVDHDLATQSYANKE